MKNHQGQLQLAEDQLKSTPKEEAKTITKDDLIEANEAAKIMKLSPQQKEGKFTFPDHQSTGLQVDPASG